MTDASAKNIPLEFLSSPSQQLRHFPRHKVAKLGTLAGFAAAAGRSTSDMEPLDDPAAIQRLRATAPYSARDFFALRRTIEGYAQIYGLFAPNRVA